jgi:hypothetical protein
MSLQMRVQLRAFACASSITLANRSRSLDTLPIVLLDLPSFPELTTELESFVFSSFSALVLVLDVLSSVFWAELAVATCA